MVVVLKRKGEGEGNLEDLDWIGLDFDTLFVLNNGWILDDEMRDVLWVMDLDTCI